MRRRDNEAATRLRAYFEPRVEQYGDDPRAVDWQSRAAQVARFAALITQVQTLGSLEGATLLDAGCGLGDLYGYLQEQKIAVQYTGCDLSAASIALARQHYPQARFIVGDIRDLMGRERFDVVVACGMLHLRVPRWNRWAMDQIRAMYDGCQRVVALTLPLRRSNHAPILATIDPADWLARLHGLSAHATVQVLDQWGDAVFLIPRSRVT